MAGGEEKKILVRSISVIKEVERFHIKEGKHNRVVKEECLCEDFHLVDLEKDTTYFRCLTSLFDCVPTSISDMMAAGNTIYLLGGLPPCKDMASVVEMLDDISKLEPDSHFEYYKGASRMLLTEDIRNGSGIKEGVSHGKWRPMAPAHDRWLTNCTCLDGTLYNFGTALTPPEHYDPDFDDNNLYFCGRSLITPEFFNGESWEQLTPLPEELVGSVVYIPVLPDPGNNRILMQLSHSNFPESRLYAFRPEPNDGQNWVCLNEKFPDWPQTAVAAGNMIFFSSPDPPFLSAYDIASQEELDVEWSSNPLVNNADLTTVDGIMFDALLLVADNMLCLAVSSPVVVEYFPVETIITFLKFRFNLEHKENGQAFVELTQVSSTAHILPQTSCVRDFIAL